ncbi:transporter substrate-binding protein [Terrilactibacillus laevilacticus]|uniref:transporter substrate-binding protein n=1 Tax=Terrilactibacillus laevilacticus TaxID=1380157 RepID=UPI001146E7B8|nr:transporter substrate-binding protein [Terrilactibacillus laevilacticus]
MSNDCFRIGILFSLTGCTAITETGQYQSALLAIQSVNQSGGIHGKPLEPFVEDIASDPLLTYKKAEHLIINKKVQVLIGPYTSACRKAILPLLKKYNILLLYPTLYEGNEQNDWVFYCGALPNQQLQSFVPWIISQLGVSFHLVGSDYIYPRETNYHMRQLLNINGGQVVGESYAPFGCQHFDYILKQIEYTAPDIVFSTLIGDSAVSFYQQYHQYGFQMPLCSPITAETELKAMNAIHGKEIYTSFPYFKTIQNEANQQFVRTYHDRFGSNVISSVMENTYNSVFLLCDALRKMKKFDTSILREMLCQSTFGAPQGFVKFDDNNHHLWQYSRIGHATAEGNFDVIWESPTLIAPTPFRSYSASTLPLRIYTSNPRNTKHLENYTISEEQLTNRQERWKDNLFFLNQLPMFYPYQFFLIGADGILIECIGQQSAFEWHTELKPGTKWSVESKGRNGYGLALINHYTCIVQGIQHDDPSLKKCITAGIPIIEGDECLGVLGVLSKTDHFTNLLNCLSALELFVFSFVKFIKERKNHLLYKNILQEIVNQSNSGFFLIQNENIVFMNDYAESLLIKKPSIKDMIKRNLDYIIDKSMGKPVRRRIENEVFDISYQCWHDYHLIKFTLFNQRRLKNHHKILFQDIIGKDSSFIETLNVAKTAAQTDANVLIIGESGTGKELFANAIHNESLRSDKPFVAVNCGAIAKELIQSEFFGYVGGAFTGANKNGKQGLFEIANGGTLFLDEVGELPLDLQVTLLRVLQENEITRVGDHKRIPIDVRIIAATNKNLLNEIAYKGTFRSDLYYRLSVFQINLVPLRERSIDLPELANYFLNKLNGKNHTEKIFSHKALEAIKAYSWPGNIRELSNVVERSYYLSHFQSEIDIYELEKPKKNDSYLSERSQKGNEDITVIDNAQSEKKLILNYLKEMDSNISKVAKKMGMSRTTLYKKLNVYQIKIKR